MATDRNQRHNPQQIDFLPRHYHEEYERHRTQAWRILVVSVFLVTFPTASLFQYRLRLSVDRQLAQFNEYHQNTRSDAQRLTTFSNKLGEKAAIAKLATFLRHPWPSTQIVATIVEPLPESISIEELVIRRVRPTVKRKANEGDAKAESPSVMPAIEDLQSLEEQAQGRVVVDLVGQTIDSRQLHSYLSQLARKPLFVGAELGSIESMPAKKGSQPVARFEAQLVVQPGYSLPGGPQIDQKVVRDEVLQPATEDPS